VSDRRRAWARALYGAAPDSGSREDYGEALEGIALAMRSDASIHEYLVDPSAPRDRKRFLLEAALPAAPSGGPEGAAGARASVFSRFCGLLADKGRIGLVPHIARAYRAIRDADERIARVEIESAREASAAVVERIAAAWAARSGARKAFATARVNPDLIAGYRLRSGSLRIDYSLAGRVERLRRELGRPLDSRPPARGEG